MKNKKIETLIWALSMFGLLMLVTYYVSCTKFYADLPFEMALVGVAMVFLANGLLFVRWLSDTVVFLKNKEYLATLIMILVGLFIFKGFWL